MTKPKPHTPPPGRPLELGHLSGDIAYMTRVLRAHIRAINEITFADAEVSTGQIALLNLIQLNPGVSQNELAAGVVVKKSAVTKLVSDLETRGLIERERQAGDRRYNALTLTSKGAEVMVDLRKRMSSNTDRILACLDPDERETLMALLGRVLASVAEQTDPNDSE